jgi:RNA polymerase sigma factor (sigma-70 family)
MPFVKSVVKKYLNQGVEYEDLLNSATLGLINAIDAYDPNSKNKFITYAIWHIKGQIIEELAAVSRIVRLPRGVAQTVSHVNKCKNKIENETNNTASPEEIAKEANMSVKNVKKILNIKSYHTSLDQSIGDEDGTNLIDTIKSNYITDKDAEQHSLQQLIIRKSEHLEPQEQKVLLSHFGIGTHSMSIKDLSKELQISENKIMKMKHSALAKMANHSDLRTEFKNLTNK